MAGLTEARERMKAKGTEGLFTKKAKAAGMSVPAFAAKERHSKDLKLKREAVFAANAQKGFKSGK